MGSFVAEESFWKLFPQAAIGVVVATGMKPTSEIAGDDVDEIATLLKRANVDARRHLTSDTISENEPVKAWREAYRRFKTKKGARCSVESLLKRALKDKPVGHITPAVDIYNTVSLTYALPVGGEDLHAIEGDLRLTVSEGGDAFLPLGEDGATASALPLRTTRLTPSLRLSAWSPTGRETARLQSTSWQSCSNAIWVRRLAPRRSPPVTTPG